MKKLFKILLFTTIIVGINSCKEDDPRDGLPVGLLIHKITVRDIPAKNGAYEWDYESDDSGPDVYVRVEQYDSEDWESPNVVFNANPAISHEFIPSSPILMDDIYSPSIEVYDYDNGSSYDDEMAYTSLYPENYFDSKPDSIVLESYYYGDITVVLHVEYVYQGL